jgi:DNA-binding CsgD family transcriptional regulator
MENTEFTGNELKALKLICSDVPYKMLAPGMFISVRTFEKYVKALFKKTGMHTRAGLIIYAIRHKIFNPFESID